MKFRITVIFALFLSICLMVLAGQNNLMKQITPAVTSIAANSTNTAKGTDFFFGQGIPESITFYGRAKGANASATNNVIIRLERYNGTNWSSAAQSFTVLTLPMTGATTNQVDDFFHCPGVFGFRVGQIENQCSVAVSNIEVWATYTSKEP